MAKVYADLIRKGIKTLEDVPIRLRDEMEACFKCNWLPDIVGT